MGSSTKSTTTSSSSIATQEGFAAAQSEVDALRKQLADYERKNSGVSLIDSMRGKDGRALIDLRKKLSAAEKRLAAQQGYIGRTPEEEAALEAQTQGLADLQGMIGQGPGDADVAAGVKSQREFADLLEKYQAGGFLPGQADIDQSRGLVEQLFAGQKTALDQQLEQQRRMSQRNAALSGRGINDPVFQNQLAQTQLNQQQLLQSQMTSASAEQAQNLPMQRLQFAEAATNARLGLGNQAMQNRQLLLQLGNTLREQERSFRLNAANKNQVQTQVQQNNPGALGVISGIAGAGGALMSGFGSMRQAGFFGGGGGSAAPAPGQDFSSEGLGARGVNFPGYNPGAGVPAPTAAQSGLINQIRSTNSMQNPALTQQSFNNFLAPQQSGYGQQSTAYYNPFLRR
jgi:hypothetical protein